VARGYYSPAQAAERFGVVLDSAGAVDDGATAVRRKAARRTAAE
jgi:hypothetical protein